jgi:hypothetical protein
MKYAINDLSAQTNFAKHSYVEAKSPGLAAQTNFAKQSYVEAKKVIGRV